MPDTRALQERIGLQMEQVISDSPDPQEAMRVLAEEAVRVGLVHSPKDLRRSSPQEFVKDLWLDNPVILDRLSLQEPPPNPSRLKDLPALIDVLR